ncbi:hypothetical protein [Roseobacter litoralis]|uniref:hypothetical protein n=1 Tax=Roseobacter litoralis TaxID=42443 RepID=UPI00249270EB|nr:hypothetical protein [Roseobacter litoralis]
MLLPPNIALMIWPVIVLALFMTMSRQSALSVGLVWGYLLLPEAFKIDVPLLPPLTKNSVTVFTVLVCLLLFKEKFSARGPQKSPSPLINEYPSFGILLLGLLVLMFLNEVATVLTNTNPLIIGSRFIPGLTVSDLISATVRTMVLVAPYFLGRAFFKTPEDHRKLLRSLVLAGLVYSLFILLELRLSPQLHNWVYGYHQHSFAQHVRGGSFRPKVFLQHGLWVGLFVLMVVLAAGGMSRNKAYADHTKWMLACGYLLVLLVFSSNLGALGLAILFLPLLWLRIGVQVRVAALVALLFVSYPAARQANLVPLDQISTFSSKISEERADSFMFRLRNEEILLERAFEKPLFGWGGWGRNRVFNEIGNDISVTDGLWVIVLGTSGWIGYLTFFGLLAAPLMMLPRVVKKHNIPPETAAIALIMAANLIYLVPNSALSPLAWLLTGALAGFVQYRQGAKVSNVNAVAEPSDMSRVSPYTRFPHGPTRDVAVSAQGSLSDTRTGRFHSPATSMP